jgi:hypothetical protein
MEMEEGGIAPGLKRKDACSSTRKSMYAFYRSRIGQPRAISSPSREPSMKRDHSPSRPRPDPGNRRPDVTLAPDPRLLTHTRPSIPFRATLTLLFCIFIPDDGPLMDSRHKPRGSSHRPQIPLDSRSFHSRLLSLPTSKSRPSFDLTDFK